MVWKSDVERERERDIERIYPLTSTGDLESMEPTVCDEATPRGWPLWNPQRRQPEVPALRGFQSPLGQHAGPARMIPKNVNAYWFVVLRNLVPASHGGSWQRQRAGFREGAAGETGQGGEVSYPRGQAAAPGHKVPQRAHAEILF